MKHIVKTFTSVCSTLMIICLMIPSASALTVDNKIELVERGIVINPEKIKTIGSDSLGQVISNSPVSSDLTEENPEVRVVWQNPKYASKKRWVSESVCTNTNYRVIYQYYDGYQNQTGYECYTGSGVATFSLRPMIGYVVQLCPGRNSRSSILFQNTRTSDQKWYWSTPNHPASSSNFQCYAFTDSAGKPNGTYRGVKYKGVSLTAL